MTKVQAEEVVPENTVLTLPEESRGTGKTNIRDDYELILVEPQPRILQQPMMLTLKN